MLIVPCDGASISGLAWVFKLLPIRHTETSICMPGHSWVQFRDQHVVL